MITTSEEEFKNFLNKNNEPEWLTQYRVNSFNKIKTAEMPDFKHGLNINIKPDEKKFYLTSPKNDVGTNIQTNIYENSGIKIFSNTQLDANIETQFPKIKDFFSNEWDDEEDKNKLHYFNESFTNKFLIIKIPKNLERNEPIKINYDMSNSINIFTILVLAEENSKSKIILNRSGNNAYYSENIKIIAEPNSKIDFITSQNFDDNTTSFQKRKAICLENSEVLWTDVCLGSNYTKSSITSLLKGRGSRTNNIVLYLATDDQKFDIYTASIHANQDTYSDIVTKGVINDTAKALSRGLVKIEENAPKSSGYEKQDILLLSDRAEADAIPNLEIHNHDVKCSHGSTVGQIDEDLLFYMMTRGLNKQQAKQKIVEGYFSPVLEIINDDNLSNKVQNYIMNSIK